MYKSQVSRVRKMVQSRIRKMNPVQFKSYALSAQRIMQKYKISGAQDMLRKMKTNPKFKGSFMRLAMKYKIIPTKK